MASEMPACCRSARKKSSRKWRLQPGKMLLVDLVEGLHRLRRRDQEGEAALSRIPTRRGWSAPRLVLEDAEQPVEARACPAPTCRCSISQQAFGYTQEDLEHPALAHGGHGGQEAVGSMGTDTPISALSRRRRSCSTPIFKQNFAQVTNPPIDPIREELVMSLVSFIGPAAQHLRPSEGNSKKQAARGAPAYPHQRRPREDPLRSATFEDSPSTPRRLDITYPPRSSGAEGMDGGIIGRLCDARRGRRCHGGYNIIILSDRIDRGRTASRSRRCWRPRPCTIT